jgi:hypothetical protein
MNTVTLKGVVTKDRHLQVKIPDDFPSGPVEVEIRQPQIQGVSLGDLLNSDLVGMWEDRTDIEDSVELARKLRRRASRRKLE